MELSRCGRDGPPQGCCWGCYHPCALQGLPHQCQQGARTSCQPRDGRRTAGQQLPELQGFRAALVAHQADLDGFL